MLWVFADTRQQFVDWSRANGWPVPDRGIEMLLPRLRSLQGWHPQPGDLVIVLPSIAHMEAGERWEAWHLFQRECRLAPASVGFRAGWLPPRHGIPRDRPVYFDAGRMRLHS